MDGFTPIVTDAPKVKFPFRSLTAGVSVSEPAK